jgi:hypothetical protein
LNSKDRNNRGSGNKPAKMGGIAQRRILAAWRCQSFLRNAAEAGFPAR